MFFPREKKKLSSEELIVKNLFDQTAKFRARLKHVCVVYFVLNRESSGPN